MDRHRSEMGELLICSLESHKKEKKIPFTITDKIDLQEHLTELNVCVTPTDSGPCPVQSIKIHW